MWEHEANRRGGKWSFVVPTADAALADAAWLAVRLAAIGETFPGRDVDICGVTASKKRHGMRISVWTRYASDAVLQQAIGAYVRAVCYLPSAVALHYTEHASLLATAGPPGGRGRSPTSLVPLLPDAAPHSRSLSPLESHDATPRHLRHSPPSSPTHFIPPTLAPPGTLYSA